MTASAHTRPPAAPRAVVLLPGALLLHVAEEWFGGFPAWISTTRCRRATQMVQPVPLGSGLRPLETSTHGLAPRWSRPRVGGPVDSPSWRTSGKLGDGSLDPESVKGWERRSNEERRKAGRRTIEVEVDKDRRGGWERRGEDRRKS